MPAGGLDIAEAYPFSAICGMEEAKKALLCALVNPSLKSVVMIGPSGSAKTALARSMAGRLSGRRLINIPANVSEEQLFGGLDFQATVERGGPVEMPGLLHRAHGNIAYIDDANLLDNRLLVSVLDTVSRGEVVLEREGISSKRPCDTLLVATMNSEEAELSDGVMDRFDLCVYVTPPEEHEERAEVLRRNMAFETDPAGFLEERSDEEARIADGVDLARRLLPHVTIDEELLRLIAELCARIGAEGHRGDLAMARASSALAALDGRDEVLRKDVEEAASICLVHRRNYSPPPPPPGNDHESGERSDECEREPQDPDRDDGKGQNDRCDDDYDAEGEREHVDAPSLDDMLFEIGEPFKVIDYLASRNAKRANARSRMGRRTMAESEDGRGRYVRPRAPSDSPRDVAFDATIRAAAPYQRSRDGNGLAVVIEPRDIREKMRERRCGYTILFLVDASGSLGVRKRMAAVKGAVLSMLRDSYVRRDHIGLMAFRRNSTELILSPTRSVEYAYKKLDDLPTGGKTPLGGALVEASRFMITYSRAHPGERCFIVLVTDGRANVPMVERSNANEEALRIAEGLVVPGVKWVVVDAGTGRPRFDNAVRLAENLGADLFSLNELNADHLADGVRAALGRG